MHSVLKSKIYNKQRQSFRLKCDLKVSLEPASRFEIKYASVTMLTLLILTIYRKKVVLFYFIFLAGEEIK